MSKKTGKSKPKPHCFEKPNGSTSADCARSLIGSLDSGTPDLADQHRAYVVASLKRRSVMS